MTDRKNSRGGSAAGEDLRPGPFSTDPALEPKLVYGPADTDGISHNEQIGAPGAFPFTRGIRSTMYRGRFWTMRQYAGFGSAAETNRRFQFLLSQGQTGLSTAFDLPTQMGYDSDHPVAEGEVGRSGVAIDTIEDMETLLEGIPLDKVSTSMTINATAAILLCLYVAVARKRGIREDALSGTVQNDILKEYAARGTYIYPPGPSMRLVTDLLGFASERLPRWNAISVSGYHIREAGSTAVQELAFTLADGVGYVQAAVDAGMEVDAVAPRLSFFFNSHNDFFEEICKLRAARRLWARIMKERFGAKDERSCKLRTHVQTAGCSLTAQQAYNNVARVTVQALAAVLGGTQSLHTNSLDETLALPTEEAATIALRTQQILAEESGVANTIDPLAGSYFVERLTSEMEAAAAEYIRRIDEMGGIVAAIERGFPQKEIADAAYRYQIQIDSGEKTIVGMNKYVMEEKRRPDTLKIGPEVEREQLDRLSKVRAGRDARRHSEAIAAMTAAAGESRNLMPYILDAVRAYASVGEICGALKPVFGEYREQSVL